MDRWKLIFYTCVFREFFKMSQSAKTVASCVNRYSVCGWWMACLPSPMI